jgi:hypothetical protein
MEDSRTQQSSMADINVILESFCSVLDMPF